VAFSQAATAAAASVVVSQLWLQTFSQINKPRAKADSQIRTHTGASTMWLRGATETETVAVAAESEERHGSHGNGIIIEEAMANTHTHTHTHTLSHTH